MSRIVLGPILGFASQSETDLRYHCTVVLDGPGDGVPRIDLVGQGQAIAAVKVATLATGAEVWTAEFALPVRTLERRVAYRWLRGRKVLERTIDERSGETATDWKFLVPGAIQEPRILFASCNGFSDPKLKRDQDEPFALWERMVRDERDAHLLVMGGDQVYADSVVSENLGAPGSEYNLWLSSNHKNMLRTPWTKTLDAQTHERFESVYKMCWNHPSIAKAMATIPSVMMWDDHDIMDGWGSYPEAWQKSAFLQGYYAVARWFFEILQMRGAVHCRVTGPASKNLTQFLRMGSTAILLLDGRSERTQDQVLSSASWKAIHEHLSLQSGLGTLFVVAGVPLVYLDFRGLIPFQETSGMKDDLLDHWRHPRHVQEMTSLAHRLFEHLEADRFAQIALLSGDVHVGAWAKLSKDGRTVHQTVSSGIVHPPPNRIQWAGVRALSKFPDGPLPGDRIHARMCDPTRDESRFVVARNYLRLERGTDDAWWATWKTEAISPNPTARLDA